jgi:hypothetical protein
MRSLRYLLPLIPAFLMAGCIEQDVTITIQPDGACVAKVEIVAPRSMVEQQVRSEEMQEAAMTRANEEGEAEPAATNTEAKAAAEAEPKPLADAELIARLKESGIENWIPSYGATEPTVDKVEIKDDKVHVQVTARFDSLRDLVAVTPSLWSEYGFDRLVVDTNEQAKIRFTFTSAPAMARWRKQSIEQMRVTGVRAQIKYVMPGKIISSSFSNTQDNATWFALDPQKEETFNALLKLQETGIVIVVEAGGLKLTEPLDSKKLVNIRVNRNAIGAELPITDAGPGFQTDALGLVANTYYVFPEAMKRLHESSPWQQQNRLIVQAKLYCPKDRTILSAGELKLTKATADNGHNLVLVPSEDDINPYFQSVGTTYGQNDKARQSTRFQIPLQLPDPDAKSIDEVSGEVIVVTAGHWREQSLTELKADSGKAIDLSSILPGAKLVITKLTQKRMQSTCTIQVTGPDTIRQLEFKLQASDTERGGSTSNIQRDTTAAKGKEKLRSLMLTHYSFNPAGSSPALPTTLVVRMPDDVKRERVKFTLKALDLY